MMSDLPRIDPELDVVIPNWPVDQTAGPAEGHDPREDQTYHPNADAGRNPAPRKDHTMASPIEKADDRESWDHASERGSSIAGLASAATPDAVDKLSTMSVYELRNLANAVEATQDWHRQGVRDAALVRGMIGGILREAAEAVEPLDVATAEGSSMAAVIGRG